MKYLKSFVCVLLGAVLPTAVADCDSGSYRFFPLLFPTTDAYSIAVDDDTGSMLLSGWTTNFVSMASGNFIQLRD